MIGQAISATADLALPPPPRDQPFSCVNGATCGASVLSNTPVQCQVPQVPGSVWVHQLRQSVSCGGTLDGSNGREAQSMEHGAWSMELEDGA